MEDEIKQLKARIQQYEDEQKHPIKHNRELQKQVKELTYKIEELQKLLGNPEPEEVEEFIPEETFVCENPIGLETFYKKSFSKGNILKKQEKLNTVS